MSPESFAYWLNGYFEISDSNNLSPQQVQMIRDHLNLVFKKVTPAQNKKRNFDELFDSITTGVNTRTPTQHKEETRHC